jgi:hypothetical protein
MFGRQHRQAVEPDEPARIEGPYEIDRVGLGTYGVNWYRLQDLMNTRHLEGYELISHTHPDQCVSLLVWRKTDD